MNDLVKSSIESRKNAIFNAYNITEQNIIEKIENLFKRINEFGENCTDNIDFESKFASSELNQEYIQLFTEIATSCSQIVRQSEENTNVKSDEEAILEDISSELKYQAKEAIQPIRSKIYQETYDEVRDIPIVGDILNVKQHVDFFSRFKKKKEKDEDKEEKTLRRQK